MKKLLLLLLVTLSLSTFSQVKTVKKNKKQYPFKVIYGKVISVKADMIPDVPAIIPLKPVIATQISADVILVGNGSGALDLSGLINKNVKIKAGTYREINILNPHHVKIDATDVIIARGSLDIYQAEKLEIYGLSIKNVSYRGVNIRGFCNDIYFHDMRLENIGNTAISYEYEGYYDGTDQTASMNWKFERLTFENTATGFSTRGGFEEKGIRGLLKNFKFLRNTIKNCPGIGNIIWMAAAENYEIAYNNIDKVNSIYPSNAPNGIHNGIFAMLGNGSFHHNKIRNHQGNAIRAWGMSYGTVVKDICIYDNIVWNSWKYSAFELQIPPDMQDYIKKYPLRTTFVNAKVYNNTAGNLNNSKDWEGQMLDLYSIGGTLEYYNNLGFDMNRNQGVITDMINWNGNTKVTKKYGNKYFAAQKQAVKDISTFKSLHKNIGAR